MHVVLVGPEKEENLSIRYLSSSLLAAGHDVELAGFDSTDDSETVLSACSKADIIGLSMCFQARAGEFLELARMLKHRYANVLVVAGGHYASCAAADLLRFHPEVDLIVIHEGERTLVEIADWHARGNGSVSGIRGVAYRDGTQIRLSAPRPILEDLDTLPRPDRRGPVRLVAGVPTAYVFGSRGCLNSCDYCCIKTLHTLAPGKRFRQRDPQKIADEMSELYYGRGIRQFIFHDDNFLVPSEARNHQRLDAFEKAFQERGFGDIGLYIKCRPGDLTWGIIKRLHKMGLVRLFMGIESSSANGYASLGRKQTVEESESALQFCDDLGLSVQFTLLMFHPEATIETIHSDINFIQNHLNHPFNFGRAELHAGTPLERRMLEAGQARGNYLARGYSISDPAADLVWNAWRGVLRERCSAETSLMNNAINLNYLSAVMNRFYEGSRIRELSEDIKEWELRVNTSSLHLLTRLVDACQTNTDPGSSRLIGLLRELKKEESTSRDALSAEFEELHQRLNTLTLRMVGLEEQDGRLADGVLPEGRSRDAEGARGSMARHIMAVALAFNVAGAIPTFGCMDMEERVLDVDQDNLYDDLEMQVFETDPEITDTDENGITDDLEDHDDDGITNYDEQLGIEAFVAAARSGSKNDIDRLIDEGVELDAIDPFNGDTALTGAVKFGNPDIVVSLLEAGADVNSVDAAGWTALIAAATQGNFDSVSLLLEAGADPNSSGTYGQTVLHSAAGAGKADVVQILIQEGADVDAQTDNGWTALMDASFRGHIEVVQVLLERGAALNIRNNEKKTALMIAKKEGHTQIVDLLRRWR